MRGAAGRSRFADRVGCEHTGSDVIGDVAVDHPRSGIVGDHVGDLHAAGQQLDDVGPIVCPCQCAPWRSASLPIPSVYQRTRSPAVTASPGRLPKT